ncbi:MAG: hypothetical protein A2234_09060 [Elusimicrobia bacterium RIFOXYA2_FULL_58_8]|nr:MAG: hypothetical protein A2234_09060 [Elusimicrobia bacterium RIFOXYA2_FULL_58_8]
MTPIIANLLLILLAGWLFRKYGIVQEGAEKAFNQYLYYLALPALTIVKIAAMPLSGLGWQFLAGSTLPLLGVMLAAVALWKAGAADWRFARLLVIVPALGNTAYLGFPVVGMRFGEDAIGYAAIAGSLQSIFVFTFGCFIMTLVCDKTCPPARLLRMLGRNVVLWASVVGLLMAGFGLRLPGLVNQVLSDIGKTTLPLALFTIGVSLYGKRVVHNLPRIALISGLKLLLMPVLFLGLAGGGGSGGLSLKVAFLQACMPVAVLNFIIAKEFDFDADLVSQSILFSTLAFFPLLYLYDWALLAFL